MHFTYRAHSFVSCFRELIIVDFRSRPQHTNPISHKFDRKKRCQNIHRVECQFHSVQACLSCITTNCTQHNANVLAFVTFAISAKKMFQWVISFNVCMQHRLRSTSPIIAVFVPAAEEEKEAENGQRKNQNDLFKWRLNAVNVIISLMRFRNYANRWNKRVYSEKRR